MFRLSIPPSTVYQLSTQIQPSFSYTLNNNPASFMGWQIIQAPRTLATLPILGISVAGASVSAAAMKYYRYYKQQQKQRQHEQQQLLEKYRQEQNLPSPYPPLQRKTPIRK